MKTNNAEVITGESFGIEVDEIKRNAELKVEQAEEDVVRIEEEVQEIELLEMELDGANEARETAERQAELAGERMGQAA